MPFQERGHAAHLLAKRLAGYRGQRPLVLGIPRGAVPMANALPKRRWYQRSGWPFLSLSRRAHESGDAIC